MKAQNEIVVKGAREHNLTGFDLRLPRNQLTVITGVSGSGKSSLAFDTLYAEGYRKYMESLSVQARQVMRQLPRPEVDYIEGLSPVVAISQRGGHDSPRSTVATVTEIADYARLLWATAGTPFCPLDGGRVEQRTLDQCIEELLTGHEGERAVLLAPLMRAKPAVIREEWPRLKQKGYQRVRIDGEVVELTGDPPLQGRAEVQLDLVVDRVILRREQRARLADSLELAFGEGGDRAIALIEASGSWIEKHLSQDFACEICGAGYPTPTPRLFNWNHPEGACPECGGLGETRQFHPGLLVPDPSKSVRGGALKPLRLGSKRIIIRHNALLKQLAEQLPFDPTLPWSELADNVRDQILHGAGDRLFSFKLQAGNRKPEVLTWRGVIAELEELQRQTSSDGLRARLSTYQIAQVCPTCEGARLNAFARAVQWRGLGIHQFMRLSLTEALRFVSEDSEAEAKAEALRDALKGLRSRLQFLVEVGLGYLTLDRSFNSLSGGEAQRVRLGTQVGMGIVGVIYVLDEPSIGLHPLDQSKLLSILRDLRDRGNTVVVVEHDAATMRAADHLVELGPGAGPEGGQVIFEGPPHACLDHPRSRTGPYLSGRLKLGSELTFRPPGKDYLEVLGARSHNLREVDVRFALGCLSVVCGVSGSGKSTLVNEVLGRAAALRLNGSKVIPGAHRGLRGLESIDKVIRIDQSPIGRSPRSNPATFTKVFDLLRQAFATTPLARVRGYGPGRFSFNTPGGRCERCKGDGVIKLDMQFLSDAYVQCPACGGQRYNRETLEIRYRGLNISEVLRLSVSEAATLFQKHPKLAQRLRIMEEVGLGYLQLGQSATTLSGGEAQRLKLSLELAKRDTGSTLYLLDEPTTGLHWADIEKLLTILFRLRDAGNTIIVIEHDLDFIGIADWIVELGPGGGDEGGDLLFAGARPDWLASTLDSPTRRALEAQPSPC